MATGLDYQTLRGVARRFELSRRAGQPRLSAPHGEVCALIHSEQDRWLDLAAAKPLVKATAQGTDPSRHAN
ncbi:MAG: hypothetical protein ACTHMY_10530 [Solirubrobacteraceae bacterium]